MKRFRFLAALLVSALILACNFTEEIHFNADGSGKIDIHFDGDELMAMMASMDSTGALDKSIDSTLVFKDLLELKKDSIAQLSEEEQAKLKKLEPFSMRMVVDQAKGVMKFNLFSEFDKVADVNDAFNAFQDASSFGPGPKSDNGPSMSNQQPATQVSYSFEGNTFTRNTKVIDRSLFEQGLDSLQGAEMFLSGSTYTFKYHFPRRVKKVNVEGATFSMDGKTMIYEVNFLDLMKKPETMNLEVELEN
ncbi:hypothetical protein ABV409_07115 [Flagellimonas sp. DF-77]|uniref:hypothetical protein n=1 Tax=Flagellimonas algarum TaxID=3230298 RepID=UPI0033912E7F